MESIVRPASDGTPYAMLPPHPGGPAPTLLLFALAAADTLTSEPYGRVGRRLHECGWNVVSLDLPCHGADRRTGEPAELAGWADRIARGEDIVASFQQRVNAVLAHLATEGVLDLNRLAAAGTSRGGFLALQAAAANAAIRAVVAFAPVTDLGVLQEFAGLASQPLLPRLALAHAVEALAGRPIWITIGHADERVGTGQAVAFAEALSAAGKKVGSPGTVTVHIRPVAGHTSLPEWHDEAAGWLLETLGALPGRAGHNEITASIWAQYTWRPGAAPNPVTWPSAAEWRRLEEEEKRAGEALRADVRRAAPGLEENLKSFHERFGTAECVRRARAARPPEPAGTWPGWYEPRDMIAIALGAPEPVRLNGMWWHDRNHYALAEIRTAAELARVPVPDWPRTACVQRMLESRARWQREFPDEPASGFGSQIRWDHLMVPGRGEVTTLCYPSFVDLGIYLMGGTRFCTVLAGEPDLADALMEFCFDLSTSYIDFLHGLQPFAFAGLTGFGGDATFFLSPGLFDRYGAAWDDRLFDDVRSRHKLPASMPCNYHSCGASAHLYESWGRHPRLNNITAIQTRLVPGTVGRLRAALPKVQLELTLHPPEFDLARATAAQIRDVLRSAAREAGGRNLHFAFIVAVHHPEQLPALERNIRVCHEIIADLRSGESVASDSNPA